MAHSVSSHLGIQVRSYDESIRRFIPGYTEMLAVAASQVVGRKPRQVVDLGAGTGALSKAILAADDRCAVTLLDVDLAMLDLARERLSGFLDRVRFAEQTFLGPLPCCDSCAASLALHHVRTIEAKRALYRSIWNAVNDGGVFVNADAAMPTGAACRDAVMGEWVQHMVSRGIAEQDALSHLAQWAEQDTYFALQDELAAMAAAGFTAKCAWREGPMAVLVGEKAA